VNKSLEVADPQAGLGANFRNCGLFPQNSHVTLQKPSSGSLTGQHVFSGKKNTAFRKHVWKNCPLGSGLHFKHLPVNAPQQEKKQPVLKASMELVS
jgi:hypothetical protein